MNKIFQELKLKAPTELQKMIKDDREKLRSLRFDLVAGKVKNVNELRTVRKNIARVLTIINSGNTIAAVKKTKK